MATFASGLDPSVLAAIQNAANGFAQQSGAYDWTTLLGAYNDPSKPLPFGYPTLTAQNDVGMIGNPLGTGVPTVAEQGLQGMDVHGNPSAATLASEGYAPGNLNYNIMGNTPQLQGITGNQTMAGLAAEAALAAAGGQTLEGKPSLAAQEAGGMLSGQLTGVNVTDGNGAKSFQSMQDIAALLSYSGYDPTKLTPQQQINLFGQIRNVNASPVYGADQATLANQQNYAEQFGTLGSFGANGSAGAAGGPAPQTLAAQTLYGNSGGAAGGGTATLGARQQAGNFIQNAAAGASANPFTAQAKLQGLQQAGALGGILGNNLQAASGQSMQQLQSTPNLTNTQLATDLANNSMGRPMSPLTTSFLQMMGVGGTSPSGQPQGEMHGGPVGVQSFDPGMGEQAGGAINPPDGGTTVIGGNHYHLGANNPLTAQNPGGATPLQEFNQLDPSSQQAYIDLQQNMPNGQATPDFMSQMKRAAPSASFKPAAFATSGV